MRPFSVVVRAEGRLEEIAVAIERSSAVVGLVGTRELYTGGMRIPLQQRLPWYMVLLRALPQHWTWELIQQEQAVEIRLLGRFAWWYVTVIWATSLLWTTGLLWSFDQWSADKPLTVLSGLVVLLSLAGVLYGGHLALGRGHTDGVLERVRRRALRPGRHLWNHRELGLRVFPARAGLLYALYFLGVATALVLVHGWLPSDLLENGIVLSLIGLLGAFCVLLILVARSRAFAERFVALLPGFDLLVGLLLLYTTMLPTWLFATLASPKHIHGLEALATLTPVEVSSAQQVDVGAVERAASNYRSLSRLLWVITLALLPLTALALRTTAKLASRIRLRMERIHGATGHEKVQPVIAGTGFLRSFRLTLGVAWLIAGTGVLVGAACALAMGVSALLPDYSDLLAGRALRLSRAMAAVAVGLPADSLRIHLLVRGFWIFYAVVGVTPHVLSLRNLRRSYAHGRLVREQLGMPAEPSVLVRCMREVARTLGEAVPDLRLEQNRRIGAHVITWGRASERTIVVTTGAVRAFSDQPNLLRALLAHEMGHLVLGQVARFRWLRLLGRFTLTGDTFVVTFYDSAGAELAADRFAVERVGVPPRDLVAALRVAHRLPPEKKKGGPLPEAVACCFALHSEVSQAKTSARKKRSEDFRQWYTRPWTYWHPHYAVRIAALTAMTKASEVERSVR